MLDQKVEAPTPDTTPAAGQATPAASAPPGASGPPVSQSEAPPSSAAPSDPKPNNDWFRRAFQSMRYGTPIGEAPAPAGAAPETDRADGDADSVQKRAEGGAEPTSPAPTRETERERAQSLEQRGEDTIALTPEELARRVQAETDRRLEKFQREEAARRKREERRQLREKDPYGFAKLDAEEEAEAENLQKQLEQAHRLAKSSLEAYDTTVLDPLMKLVPDQERRKILDAIEPGIPGRGQAASQALKVLEQHWKAAGVAEARKTLINDQTFIKEVLARYGGTRTEPDLVSAAAAPAPSFSMEAWIRSQGNRVRGR